MMGSELLGVRQNRAGQRASRSIHLFSIVRALIAQAAVAIPSEIKALLEDLLLFLDDMDVYVSDRRLVKAAAMLRVAAHTSGRLKRPSDPQGSFQQCCSRSSKKAALLVSSSSSAVGDASPAGA